MKPRLYYSLAAVASILVLVGRTITAIDPATGMAARRHYAVKALGSALRSELRELACLSVMTRSEIGPMAPGDGSAGEGKHLTAGGDAARRVRDVSLPLLALLKWYARRRTCMTPAVHVWPGKIVSPIAPLITIDPASGTVTRWWARWCIRLGRVPADPLTAALEAMHSEAMDHIRAGRPVEAAESMQALADLLEPVWQGYAAYGHAYDQDSASDFWVYKPTVGARIIRMLEPELRAAAVSPDEQIRLNATAVPLLIARSALRQHAARSIRDGLALLLSVYDAVAGDMTDGGRQQLPATGLARRRIGAPFRTVLSFTLGDLQREIDQAAHGSRGTNIPTDAQLDAAQFAVTQLGSTHHQLLVMLRKAIQLRDDTTLREVMRQWRMPDASRVRDAVEESSAKARLTGYPADHEPSEVLARQENLVRSLDLARNELAAMFFRLFADALQADRQAQAADGALATQQANLSVAQRYPEPVVSGPDPAVVTTLGLLPAGKPWQILEAALDAARHYWLPPPRDEEISPTGVVVTSLINPIPAAFSAFVLAAMLRPDLIAGEPDPAITVIHADALRAAVDGILAHEKPWLQRYGVAAETADQRGAALRDQITETERTTRRREQDVILASPIPPPSKDRLKAVAQEAFRAADITSRMLAWAGNPLGQLGDQDAANTIASAPATAQRVIFLDPNNNDIPELAVRLGQLLAQRLMGELLITADRHGKRHVVNGLEGPALVRSVITDLRTNRANGASRQPAPARVIALIPARPFEIRNHLGVTATAEKTWLHGKRAVESDRARLLKELGMEGGLSWQLYGLINDVPVIRVLSLQDRIVLIDLARFVQVRMSLGNSGRPWRTDP